MNHSALFTRRAAGGRALGTASSHVTPEIGEHGGGPIALAARPGTARIRTARSPGRG